MESQAGKILATLVLLPTALLLVSSAAAQENDSDHRMTRDLVITEDTQIALLGRSGKAIIGSCKTEDPLWKGKIAIKNIGSDTIKVATRPAERLAPTAGRADDDRPPHVRVYVPNNIELQAEARLTHDLKEFGQELLELSVGEGQPKCRNYDAPPVFDERLSGRPGPLHVSDGPVPDEHSAWRIKKIQRALIEKGYPLRHGPDGDYGPETVRAVIAFLKERGQRPPPGVQERPPSPEIINLLFEALEIGDDAAPDTASISTGDECKRGVNLVPIYIELDPERAIRDENRANNRVQFTVAIDCSNVAR